MDMNWNDVAADLEKGAAFVNSPAITALAALGGPVAEGFVSAAQGFATASSGILETAQTAGAAVASGDLDKIKAADAVIRAQNDQLGAKIAAS